MFCHPDGGDSTGLLGRKLSKDFHLRGKEINGKYEMMSGGNTL